MLAIRIKTGILIVITVLMSTGVCLAISPVNKSMFTGVAIKGYDCVAYFTEGRPIKGLEKYMYQWQDAKWRFATEENRNRFRAAPDKYAPRYGGYCAWAVSQGMTAGIDPNAWKIVGNKLYLNYDHSIQMKWEKDISGNIASADKNWPELLKKK